MLPDKRPFPTGLPMLDLYDQADDRVSAQALKTCLDYLQTEARRAGFDLPANLIGAASHAMADHVAAEARQPAPRAAAPGCFRFDPAE